MPKNYNEINNSLQLSFHGLKKIYDISKILELQRYVLPSAPSTPSGSSSITEGCRLPARLPPADVGWGGPGGLPGLTLEFKFCRSVILFSFCSFSLRTNCSFSACNFFRSLAAAGAWAAEFCNASIC